MMIKLQVSKMKCNGCVANVQQALEQVSGTSSAEVNLENGTALVHGEAAVAELLGALESAGYPAEAIK